MDTKYAYLEKVCISFSPPKRLGYDAKLASSEGIASTNERRYEVAGFIK